MFTNDKMSTTVAVITIISMIEFEAGKVVFLSKILVLRLDDI